VSFISARKFSRNRKQIKAEISNAIVVPMFPGISRWKLNLVPLKVLLALLHPQIVIGRGVFATQLALMSKFRKIVYDGRGAIAAEWREYGVGDGRMISQISGWEKECVLKSNYRISVSEKLLEYWKTEYNYSGKDHVVIPCTLSHSFAKVSLTPETISDSRKDLGFDADDVVFVFSGSSSGWQSFDLIRQFLKKELEANNKSRALFLSEKNEIIDAMAKEFPGRVTCKKVSPDLVPHHLIAADFGILIREKSITNKVASPVKFAEYLACGLKAIISEELGDFSEFVERYNCGSLYTRFQPAAKVPFSDKARIRELALKHFNKKAYSASYKAIAGV
jgi:hypothetical protein